MLTVVFDLGGVLATQTSQVPDAARLLGAHTDAADPGAADRAYWLDRHAWDAGCDDADYWRGVARELGVTADDDTVRELVRRDCELWANLRPAAVQLVADVHATGTPTWLLSNAPAAFAPVIAARPWSTSFDGMVVSGVERVTKPDERIYRIVEQRTGARGDQVAFVDDRADNIAAAAALGWHTHLWSSDDETRAWLVGLGVLPG